MPHTFLYYTSLLLFLIVTAYLSKPFDLLFSVSVFIFITLGKRFSFFFFITVAYLAYFCIASNNKAKNYIWGLYISCHM